MMNKTANKGAKKVYKTGKLKLLVRESSVLSRTRFLSTKIIRVFESGVLSPLISTVKYVDSFVAKNITGPIREKFNVRENFSKPLRNTVSSFIDKTGFMNKIASFREAFLNTSIRSIGLFFITFGIYAAAIFFLKHFVSLSIGTPTNVDSLSVALVSLLSGLLLSVFGDKSIVETVGNSKILGLLLSKCLGVNRASMQRYTADKNNAENAVGAGFLLGSFFGVLTLFFYPIDILAFLLTALVFIVVFHIPEFGLLVTVSTLSFCSVKWSLFIGTVTLLSYLLKCIRLKRNFRFGTADVLMLVFYFLIVISCNVSGGYSQGERYFLCCIMLYFMARNMLCSKALLLQTFNALCVGLCLGMLLYIVNEFNFLVTNAYLSEAIGHLTSNTMSSTFLAVTVSATLPFAFSSFMSNNGNKPKILFVFLAIICAVISDSLLFYGLVLAAFFVFFAMSYKAPAGSILCALLVMPVSLVLLSDYTIVNSVAAFKNTMFDSALGYSSDIVSMDFWNGLAKVGGAAAFVVLFLTLLLVLQRMFAALLLNNAKNAQCACGAVAGSVTMLIACSAMFNLFSDLRTIALLWFVMGLGGSVYKVYSRPQYDSEV